MGGNNKYQSTIGQNHRRRLGGIITAGACVPIILQSRLKKVKALVGMEGEEYSSSFTFSIFVQDIHIAILDIQILIHDVLFDLQLLNYESAN